MKSHLFQKPGVTAGMKRRSYNDSNISLEVRFSTASVLNGKC